MDLRMDGSNRKWKIAAGVAFAFTIIGSVASSQTAPRAASPAASVFKTNCAVCHGDDGAGSALGKHLHTPDLRSSRVHQQTPSALAAAIGKGKNNMPPFAAKLSSKEIQQLVEYVRQFHAAPVKRASQK